jgi:PAT family beta-lactamase induction signal transducer AmpG
MPPSSRASASIATLIGGFAGGYLARRYSLVASLWIGGVLQAISKPRIRVLALVGGQPRGGGRRHFGRKLHRRDPATVIFVAYLSARVRTPAHRHPKYALRHRADRVGAPISSLRRGHVAEATGWPLFFVISVLVAVPA